MHDRRFLLAAVALIAACQAAERSPSAGGDWAVTTEAAMRITDAPGHEFSGISSALRLSAGDVLVANTGGPELLLFDAAGQFVRTVGRKGGGPGEFQGPVSVFMWRGDSVAVYDPSAARWTILDPTLAVARSVTAPDSSIRQPTWLYQGAMIRDGIVDDVPSWALQVLTALRSTDAGFTRLMQGRRDDLGALWMRDASTVERWHVYTDSGEAAAQVTLPMGLEPLHIGRDFVLGVVQDTLGVEQVALHMFERRTGGSASSVGTVRELPRDAALLSAIPSLIIAQEMHYATHASYAAHADSLSLKALPYRVFMLAGDKRRWSAVAVVPTTGVTCGVSVGLPAPQGWLDGTPFCGR